MQTPIIRKLEAYILSHKADFWKRNITRNKKGQFIKNMQQSSMCMHPKTELQNTCTKKRTELKGVREIQNLV